MAHYDRSIREKIDDLMRTYGGRRKDALRECEKRLKKKPKDILNHLWRAELHFQAPDNEDDKAIEIYARLCESKTFVIDAEHLSYIYIRIAAKQQQEGEVLVSAGMEVLKLFDVVAKTLNPAGAIVLWQMLFEEAVSVGYWRDAQRALLFLKTKNPNEELYHWGLIVIAQLVADSLEIKDEKGAKIASLQAYKMLSTALDLTSKSPESMQAISNHRKLRLLVQIYSKQGRQRELLDVLDSGNTAIAKICSQHSSEFRRLRFQILEKEKMWQRLFDEAYSIIKAAYDPEPLKNRDSLNDWHTWHSLAKSEMSIKTATQQMDEIVNLAEKYNGSRPHNAMLVAMTRDLNEGNWPDLRDLCQSMFSKQTRGAATFNDLQPFVEALPSAYHMDFLSYIGEQARQEKQKDSDNNQVKWMRVEVESLKFEYVLRISKEETSNIQLLEEFSCNALRLAKIVQTCSLDLYLDSSLLGIMGLVRLYHQSNSADSQLYMIKAAYIMNCLVKTLQKHNHLQIRKINTLLLRFHLFLGLGSLANDAFSKLGCKEILQDTMSHLYFTRISISHPKMLVKTGFADPTSGIDKALKMYRDSAAKITQTIESGLERLEYDRTLELQEFKKNLQCSIFLQILMIERRRISRLRGEKPSISVRDFSKIVSDNVYDHNGALIPDLDFVLQDFESMTDNRDFNLLWNFESVSRPPFESYISNGPRPGSRWLALFVISDTICSIIDSNPLIAPPKIIATAYGKMQSNDGQNSNEFSPGEDLVSNGWLILYDVIAATLGQEDDREVIATITPGGKWELSIALHKMKIWIQGIIDNIEPWLIQPNSQSTLLPEHRIVHPMFLFMDFILAMNKLHTRLLKPPVPAKANSHVSKADKTILTEINDLVNKLATKIFDNAFKWANWLDDGDRIHASMEKVLLDGPIGECIQDTVMKGEDDQGGNVPKALLLEFVASARETIEGLLS